MLQRARQGYRGPNSCDKACHCFFTQLTSAIACTGEASYVLLLFLTVVNEMSCRVCAPVNAASTSKLGFHEMLAISHILHMDTRGSCRVFGKEADEYRYLYDFAFGGVACNVTLEAGIRSRVLLPLMDT